MRDTIIKLIVLDVDGVLTDGRLLIGSNGEEYKSFNVKDGMGISIAKHAGIEFAIITGRESNAVTIRAKELGINYVYQGISNKDEILQSLLLELNLKKEEVCYMGDDLNDLPIIMKVGISFAPSNAIDFIKSRVKFVTSTQGGEGAVREMIEKILKRQTDYNKLLEDYLFTRYNVVQ